MSNIKSLVEKFLADREIKFTSKFDKMIIKKDWGNTEVRQNTVKFVRPNKYYHFDNMSSSPSFIWSLDYFQGSAHTEPPTAENVLYSLICDLGFANDTFEEFCANCGYSDDSIMALRTYEKICDHKLKMYNMFSFDEIKELVELFGDY